MTTSTKGMALVTGAGIVERDPVTDRYRRAA
jgi:hypothetical protein